MSEQTHESKSKKASSIDLENTQGGAGLFKNSEPEGESIEQQLADCQIAQQEWKEKCMRVTADLANFNKRIAKEKAQWSAFARAEIITPLLDIVDNFDRAVEKEQMSDGVKMIHNSFAEFLKNAGVQEVAYDQFDPEMHEALIQVDSEEKESGQIVEIMQKGYTLGDKILRPAKVSVAK